MQDHSAENNSPWQKIPVANLVRDVPSGILFARLRVRGKLIRKSLTTDNMAVVHGDPETGTKKGEVREVPIPDMRQLLELMRTERAE